MTDTQMLIAGLEDLRRTVADLTRKLGERELDARLLRERLARAARDKGSTKTEATEQAKAAPEYIRHEQVTLGLAHDRDIAWARAEALRFRVQLELGRGTDP